MSVNSDSLESGKQNTCRSYSNGEICLLTRKVIKEKSLQRIAIFFIKKIQSLEAIQQDEQNSSANLLVAKKPNQFDTRILANANYIELGKLSVSELLLSCSPPYNKQFRN